jgi:RecQ-mediated genome instability protein 1
MAFPSSTAEQLGDLLPSNHQLHVSPQWISQFLASQRSTPPLASLLATAKVRILNSNITTTLTPPTANLLPLTVHNANITEIRVPGPVVVQVLAMEDMARSKWEQIEALESLERGEGTVGREVIRVVPETRDEGAVEDRTQGGIWKLLLEDANGQKVWAVELGTIAGVGREMFIGCKVRPFTEFIAALHDLMRISACTS